MKFLKNNIKLVIGFMVGVILTSGITVYAYSYLASDIGYTKPGTETAISVEQALNDLYSKSNRIPQNVPQVEIRKTSSISVYGTYTGQLDFSDVEGYENLTISDFTTWPSGSNKFYISSKEYGGISTSTSYNSNTGILTIRLTNADSGRLISIPSGVIAILGNY